MKIGLFLHNDVYERDILSNFLNDRSKLHRVIYRDDCLIHTHGKAFLGMK